VFAIGIAGTRPDERAGRLEGVCGFGQEGPEVLEGVRIDGEKL
jgi:hypothetical protein